MKVCVAYWILEGAADTSNDTLGKEIKQIILGSSWRYAVAF